MYQEQADYVYSLSRRLSRSKYDAEDLFQEAFLKAYRFYPKFRGGSIKGWLRRIVVTVNISNHRGLKNQPVTSLDDHSAWKDSIQDEGPTPHQELERNNTKEELQRALEQLTEDARTVLVLREIEGLDYQEIADVLGIPKGTVRSRIARAREALRVVLGESDG